MLAGRYPSPHVCLVTACFIFLATSLFISPCFGWESGILNVHVVPHSHNDPGWWKTFEGYYQDWTKGIISSIVQILNEDSSRTFIWAEISYFQRWWEDQQDTIKSTVRKLVKNGQLEFVTAGWVMNDEANAHMIDIINQLTEGHEWLFKTLETKPKFGWAIDPFGHSPTMPYFLQQMGFEAMVINRAHRQIKQEFRDTKHLEFIWSGDNLNSSSDFNMVTHMLPWKLYDIPNTCGPDWYVCEKFDFERDVAIPITSANVQERSETLVNMYKQKAQLFRHNSVLIPLGDDFKYKNPEMTRKIMTQYEMLFKYINSDTNLGVNIKFSTLGQYFEDVLQEVRAAPNSGEELKNEALLSLPSYQGDFFTYCDENEDYWSGYFTTRPFMKGLTRSTQAILRTGEILATLARGHARDRISQTQWAHWFDSLQTARRNVALFQHHDGVTGTARRVVVDDYANRLLSSLAQVAEDASDMALVILSKSADNNAAQNPTEHLSWVTEPAKKISIPVSRVIQVEKDGAALIVFNPLAHSRGEVVSVLVNTHEVEVVDDKGDSVASQVDPVWDGNRPSTSQFTLHFVADVPGLGLATYFLRPSRKPALSTVLEYSATSSAAGIEIVSDWIFESKPLDGTEAIVVENTQYRVTLNGYGTIKAITRKSTQPNTAEIEQSFLSYSSSGGAYLFLPHGSAKQIQLHTQAVRVITGPVVASVHSISSSSIKEYTVRLYECLHQGTQSTSPCPQSNGIEVAHTTDLTEANTEVVTRFKTNIASAGRFYTDSNGLEMRERLYTKNLPIQGNYYPITTATYIEPRSAPISDGLSSASRFTVLSHQAHGVTSLNEGELEVMLDRRLNRDDGRGLGEPITDNVRTIIPLWLVLEPSTESAAKSFAHPALSATASDVWHARNYPLHTLFTQVQRQQLQDSTDDDTTALHSVWGSAHHTKFSPIISGAIHERLQVLSLDPRDKESDDVILRVFHPPTDIDSSTTTACTFNVNMFKQLSVTNLKEMSLSLLHEKSHAGTTEYSIRPAEIVTLIVHLAEVADQKNFNEQQQPAISNDKTDFKPSTKVDDEHDSGTKTDKGDVKEAGVENWKEKQEEAPVDDLFVEKVKANSPLHENDDEPVAVDDTEIIVPVSKFPEVVTKEEHTRKTPEVEKQPGKAGKVSNGLPKNDHTAKVANTTGLYTMSIIFYLGLLVIIVVGVWLLGRRRAHYSVDDKRNHPTTSRLPTIWKEREDSMMKLL